MGDPCNLASAALFAKPFWVQHAVHRKCSSQTRAIKPEYKRIWMYWNTGWQDAPALVQRASQTWVVNNADWSVTKLDDASLHEYVTDDEILPGLRTKRIRPAAMSDLIRLALLGKYGGVWADASTLCLVPLDLYLPELVTAESKFLAHHFYNFDRQKFPSPTPNPKTHAEAQATGMLRPISSWFLYAEPDSLILREWRKQAWEFWSGRTKVSTGQYFWVHYMLHKALWENTDAWQAYIHSRFMHEEPAHQFLTANASNIHRLVAPGCLPATVLKTTQKQQRKFLQSDLFLRYKPFCERLNCQDNHDGLFARIVANASRAAESCQSTDFRAPGNRTKKTRKRGQKGGDRFRGEKGQGGRRDQRIRNRGAVK